MAEEAPRGCLAGEMLKNEDVNRWSSFCPHIGDVVEYDTALV